MLEDQELPYSEYFFQVHDIKVCGNFYDQIIDNVINFTVSIRLSKCFVVDTVLHNCVMFDLESLKAFIQSEGKKRTFVLLDKEYEQLCSKLRKHLGRPLVIKKCVYGVDFRGKS